MQSSPVQLNEIYEIKPTPNHNVDQIQTSKTDTLSIIHIEAYQRCSYLEHYQTSNSHKLFSQKASS